LRLCCRDMKCIPNDIRLINVRFLGKENIRLWNTFDMQRYQTQGDYVDVGPIGLRCKYPSLYIRIRRRPYYAGTTLP
jgi:hypothetical protein